MNIPPFLQYDDLVWRIKQVATEHDTLLDNTAVSLPVPVSDQSQQEAASPSLLAFLYTLKDEGGDAPENPEIFQPYARIQIRLDGDVVEWEALHQPLGQSTVGRRFTGLAADMEPDEQAAFIETYYELLTSDEGLLWQPWSIVESTVLHDLRELFYALVEAPFLPLYRQHADEFLNLIEIP